MNFNGLLNKTGNVQRYTTVDDGMGGQTKTWATIYRRVPIRVNALAAREIAILQDAANVKADYKIFCRPFDVREGDRFVVDGRTFEVKKVDNYDEMGHHLRVTCLEVR